MATQLLMDTINGDGRKAKRQEMMEFPFINFLLWLIR